MRNAPILTIAVAMPFLLGGCAAAVIPMIGAEIAALGYSGFKLIQTTTGGSLEIAVDVSKVTNEQKEKIKNIKSIAVWPARGGGSVSFAEALSEGGRFTVVSPSRVAAILKKLELSDDLKLMTATEAKDIFSKVCQDTNADAIIFTRATGAATNTNMWSLERANVTIHFLTSIYSKSANNVVVGIPVTIKALAGDKLPPSDEEISNLANAELAKNILALAQ